MKLYQDGLRMDRRSLAGFTATAKTVCKSSTSTMFCGESSLGGGIPE